MEHSSTPVVYSINRLYLHQAMADAYANIHATVPPPVVHNHSCIPVASLSFLNNSIWIFMPKIPTRTMKQLRIRVAVVNMTPIWRR
uniref:Magnesium transporter MRS2-3 n=1 Tax=Rhizophora mucronata TaxID=61149 RepID=A0A2P2KNI2_RHIMU